MQRNPQRDRPLRNDIYIIVALMLIYSLFHLAIPAPVGGVRPTLSTLLAGNAYILMATSLFLSTRPRFLENAFGGLDKIYRAHKICGMVSGALVFAHYFVATKTLPPHLDPELVSLSPSKQLGLIALLAMVVLLVLAMSDKIPYHRWLKPHKLMGLVFIITTAHFVTVADELFVRFGPAGIILLIAAVIGIGSYLANIFGLTRKNGALFEVAKIVTLARATNLTLKPVGNKMTFTPGQFAFLEIQNKSLRESHPFTIASAPDNDHLQFAIKSLGDWSQRLRTELKVGEKVIVRGPYGRFDGNNAGQNQIWFAGGIGITPFLSMLRDMSPNDPRHIRLIYAVRTLSEALFLREITTKIAILPLVELILLQSDKAEFATADILAKNLAVPLVQQDIFMCGPTPLVKSMKRELRQQGVSPSKIHTEVFEFR